MVITLFSMKSGAGVSVLTGLLAARRASLDHPVLAVDLVGDLSAVMGVAEPTGPGIGDWLAAPDAPGDALRRLEVEVGPGLAVLAPGSVPVTGGGALLARALEADDRTVLVDCGCLRPLGPIGATSEGQLDLVFRADVAASGRAKWLVTRACYLALRAAPHCPVEADGVVLVSETGRALGGADVARLLPAPVVVDLAVDPAVARIVDAGLLTTRLPRSLGRVLDRALGAAGGPAGSTP